MVVKKGLIKLCVPILLSVLCLWAAITSYRYGSANLSYYRVSNILDEWQSSGDKQSLEQYQLAKVIMQEVLIKHQGNPLYTSTMAEVYEWGAIAGYEDTKTGLEQANEYYKASLKLRPSWPVTWASLAMIKWRKQEFDDELLYYLKQAHHYGPLKTEVHVIYAQLGLALYQFNHPILINFKDEFYRHLALGLRNPKSRTLVIDAIKQNGLQKQVCRWLRNEPEATLLMLKGCVKKVINS
ncbi:VpsP family polysaccharide biosynthesis protein [Aliiglaciecola sp. 2_MG-2023]|uniref:VpsP family polysaccharide biosynthesis protein n=1 Tax=unclassified Aliiglaciecola TaxID=2593648 RepID=UPI0026E3F6D0|nr:MULTISPECIES: VpsP family polysaccharide biosynthesis protein [unclassified Aliiglaciecola]MDO6712193.1 VpsP family polysaccharide biosynthesis protein [Aliiglaciecola sp. 2_MG-2023]MDO6753569.1 VpsP family polysaccharide biosynthesis protein [Aliiglaciecola sp. 1_MG-2023]